MENDRNQLVSFVLMAAPAAYLFFTNISYYVPILFGSWSLNELSMLMLVVMPVPLILSLIFLKGVHRRKVSIAVTAISACGFGIMGFILMINSVSFCFRSKAFNPGLPLISLTLFLIGE